MHAPGTLILGGALKGHRLRPLPSVLSVRPILARIKKSLFDILKNRIPNAVFLDLFSGSGSVGLEALSRGARKIIFVDKNPRCIGLIQKRVQGFLQKTAQALPMPQAKFYCRDVFSGFHWLEEECDLIFSGAPYVHPVKSAKGGADNPHFHRIKKQPLFFVQKLLTLLKQEKILKQTGWFIAQHHKKESFEVSPPWDCFRQERYGDSMLSFFKPC